jgi:hypothetical protein
MIVKFFTHGKGPASGALNYFLKEKAERPSDDADQKRLPLEPRAHARVLSGDPVITEQLINATPYQQKYKSGVLSFEKRADELTEQEKFEIMQKFEDTLFCGLERDQFDILWIEHADKDIDKDNPIGRLELNFLIAGQELRSGKRLQPFYAGADFVRVNAFKDVINYEYKLADPNAPDRKRLINEHSKGAEPPTPYDRANYSRKESKKDDEVIAKPRKREALRDAINRKMQFAFDQDMIKNRYDVLAELRKMGLNIERSRSEKSVSVSSSNLVDKNGKSINVRLEGALYEEKFKAADYEPIVMKLEKKAYLSRAPQEHEHTQKILSEAIAKKIEYHKEIYKDVITPEPLNLTIVDVDIDNKAELKADAQPRFESDLEKIDAPGFEF